MTHRLCLLVLALAALGAAAVAQERKPPVPPLPMIVDVPPMPDFPKLKADIERLKVEKEIFKADMDAWKADMDTFKAGLKSFMNEARLLARGNPAIAQGGRQFLGRYRHLSLGSAAAIRAWRICLHDHASRRRPRDRAAEPGRARRRLGRDA
jgi:hypothetical protein